MKPKLFGTLVIALGIFLFVGVASASTTDVLQPASDVVYDETLVVNGTGIFDSIRVGKQGIGGVTFFNGTIVNETTDGGNPIPVTFGDDVRIDGLLWRGPTSGPGDNRPIQLDDDVNVHGDLYVDRDITQNTTSYGAVKAMAQVKSSGANGSIVRHEGLHVPTVKRFGLIGSFEINFGFDVSERFFSVIVDGKNLSGMRSFATYDIFNPSSNHVVRINTYDALIDDLRDRDFTVVVY